MEADDVSNDPPFQFGQSGQRQALWQNVSAWSRSRLGPPNIKKNIDASKNAYLKDAPFSVDMPTGQERLPYIQKIPSQLEYREDGIKTTMIMAASLYEKIYPIMMPIALNLYEGMITQAKENGNAEVKEPIASAELAQYEAAFEAALAKVESLLTTTAVSIPASKIKSSQPSLPYQKENAGYYLEIWLREQTVLHSTDVLQTTVDGLFPYVVSKHPRQITCSLDTAPRQVYWLNEGLSFTRFDNVFYHSSRWDKRRLQLTLTEPYLLLCNGMVTEAVWQAGKTAVTQRSQADGRQVKPVLVILADGVDVDLPLVSDTDVVYTVVLSSTRDITYGSENDTLPQRPQLEEMAAFFQAVVRNTWEADAPTTITPHDLGQCGTVLIDRQRTVMIAETAVPWQPDGRYEAGRGGWQTRGIYLFTIPKDVETVSEAEAILKQRIELEAGAVAGGGATYYWLSRHLLASAGQVEHWLAEALQAPVIQLLDNANIPVHSDVFGQIVTWLEQDNLGPAHVFYFDVNGSLNRRDLTGVTLITDHTPTIALGTAVQLELITSVAQIHRVVRRAVQSAWRYTLSVALDQAARAINAGEA